MARPRDRQRQKIYTAEHGVTGSKLFKTVAEMQAFVDKLLAEAWTRRRFGNRKIEVRDGRGRSRAGGSPNGWITLPLWARTSLTICHELAHALGTHGEEAHGPEFTRRLLELVSHVMGDQAGATLRQRYVELRVKIGPPLKLRDLKPLPLPKKLWRIEAREQDGVVVTNDVEATTLKNALQWWLNGQTNGQVVHVAARRIRRPVTIA